MSDIKIEGLDAFSKALRALPQNIAKNVLRGAVNAGATVIRQEAVRRAPEYHGEVSKGHPPPGTLKKAIYQKQIRELSDITRQTFFVGVRHGASAGKKGSTGRETRDAFYWRFVEFGTVKMPAQPFMRPAFEAKKVEAMERIKQYLADRIPNEVAKLNLK